jgi:hypothetical protein
MISVPFATRSDAIPVIYVMISNDRGMLIDVVHGSTREPVRITDDEFTAEMLEDLDRSIIRDLNILAEGERHEGDR